MMLAWLLACGAEGGLDQPNPPPAPPPQLTSAEPDVVRQSGVVSDVHGPTRTFVLTGEGKRVIVHLRDSGTLRLAGKPSQVQDLAAGTTLWVEGKRQGDLLVVLRASDSADEEAAASTTAPAGATTDAPTTPAPQADPASTPASPVPASETTASATGGASTP